MEQEYNSVRVYISELNKDKDVLNVIQNIDKIFRKINKLESKFVSVLRKDKHSSRIFNLFCDFINRNPESGGLRTVRSYFRIRQDSKLKEFHSYIAKRNIKEAQKMPINFKFCKFALDNIQSPSSNLLEVFNEIKAQRERVIKSMLFMSLSMAKVFNSSNSSKNFRVEFSDLINIANEAVIDAVDKFSLDTETSNFNAAIAGMISNYMINHSMNQNIMHFWPKDQRMLYKIRKIDWSKDHDISELAKSMNISEIELIDLMLADSSKNLSLDNTLPFTENDTFGSTVADNDAQMPDIITENNQLIFMLKKCYNLLTPFELKFLKLKGINL